MKRAKGDMRAEAKLTKTQIKQIQSSTKGETVVPVKVTDADNKEPIVHLTPYFLGGILGLTSILLGSVRESNFIKLAIISPISSGCIFHASSSLGV